MKRRPSPYRPSIPRAVAGLFAVAMSAVTLGALVALPATVEAGPGEPFAPPAVVAAGPGCVDAGSAAPAPGVPDAGARATSRAPRRAGDPDRDVRARHHRFAEARRSVS